MKCRLRKLHDNKSWLVEKHLTSLGKDNCDINVKFKQQIVDRKHAFVCVDEENNCFTLRDNNSTHGTYLNDRRIQNSNARLKDGDVIRLGQGGPRFEVSFETGGVVLLSDNTSLLRQPPENNKNTTSTSSNMSNLPNISSASSSSYQYRNGYASKPDKSNIVPHPPVKHRPVSANPANGAFHSGTKPTISGNWTNGLVNGSNGMANGHNIMLGGSLNGLPNGTLSGLVNGPVNGYPNGLPNGLPNGAMNGLPNGLPNGAMNGLPNGALTGLPNGTVNGYSGVDPTPKVSFNTYLDYGQQREATLNTTADELLMSRLNYETEFQKKDSVIGTLREEIDYLRQCTGLTQMKTFTTGCHEKIAALHNQIQMKNEDLATLRNENDTLRQQNEELQSANNNMRVDSRVQSDVLRDEYERLKDTSQGIGHQISELKLSVTQRDHKVALLENELCRVNKEKSQMTILLNTLQKEVTSKDEQLKKAKEEIEKYKVELRNRKNELVSMATKLSKSTELKETIKGLKQKEEESKNLKYRVKSLEDKILSSDAHIQDLHERITEADTKMAERENAHNAKILDMTYQIKTMDEKLRTKDSTVKELNAKIKDLATSLVESEQQKISLSSNELDATNRLSTILCEIENSLIENGRSCTSLNDEMKKLQEFGAADNLRWVQECFLSFLSQECVWERDIEDALKMVAGDAQRAATPPTILIHLLNEKLDKHLREIKKLEKQIVSAAEENEKTIEDLKFSLKEKYKQKAEKAIKEMRSDEKKNFDSEIKRVVEEGEQRLNEALGLQQGDQKKHLKSIHVLTEEVVKLQTERAKLKNDMDALERNLENATSNEKEYIVKVEELEKQNKMIEKFMEGKVENAVSTKEQFVTKLKSMEEICKALKESNDLKQFEIDELKHFKDQVHEQALTIKSLEYKISSMQHEKLVIEERIGDLRHNLEESKAKENKLHEANENAEALNKELEQLLELNEKLKKTAEECQKQCEEEKIKTKKIEKELEMALANLSDLKGDLSDKEKQKIEHLEERCTKQEKELLDQQMHLVKLSTLVDEQKKKLIEQDRNLQQQDEMLVDRHIPWAVSKTPSSLASTPLVPHNLKSVGERCLSKNHEEIILEQTNMIQDLNRSLEEVDKRLGPRLGSSRLVASPKALVHMSHTIEDLKDELAVQEHQANMSDQELYGEVCRLQTLLAACTEALNLEQLAHKNNTSALEECEELYLKFVRDTNTELDIPQILGAKPVSFLSDDERAEIIAERGKGLEVIVNRIKALKSRIERKDQLLEHYDDDLKSLRDTESLAGKKSFENETLAKELVECKNEISYLQEALKKWRGECDELKRQNTSLKGNKVLMMDYNGGAKGPPGPRKTKSKSKAVPAFPYAEEVKQ